MTFKKILKLNIYLGYILVFSSCNLVVPDITGYIAALFSLIPSKIVSSNSSGSTGTSTISTGTGTSSGNGTGTSSGTSSGTNTATSLVAPSGISYNGQTVFQLIPTNSVSFTPIVTGTVNSWSISPVLPAGLSFSTTTGVISGTPSMPGSTIPLTNYTVTATGPGGSTTITLQFGVYASGDNVWTKFTGVPALNTSSTNAGLIYESNCACLYFAGVTQASSINSITVPSSPYYSGFLVRYDLNGNVIWTQVFGVPTDATNTFAVSGITADSSGNIYVTGSSPSGTLNSLTVAVGGSPNTVAFIIKFDSLGNTLWTTSSSLTTRHTGSAVIADNLGFVYNSVIVQASSMNAQTNFSWTDEALMLIKFNASTGAYVTSTMVSGGASRGIEPYGNMVIDSSGNFHVPAVTRTASYCGSGSLIYNVAVYKFNSSIAYLSCSAIPTSYSGNSFAFGMSIDTSDNKYISGYTSDPNFNGVGLTGSTDAFLVKMDSSNAIQWTKLLGAAGATSEANAVAFDSSGTIYLSGMTTGNVGGGALLSAQDLFIAKYNTSGTLISIRNQGTTNVTGTCSGQGCASGLTFDPNNTLYTSGNTTGDMAGITNPASPNFSAFVVRNVK